MFCFVPLLLYALSFGPVVRVCSVSKPGSKAALPTFVAFIYTPLMSVPEPLATITDRYVMWWLK
jgi:hypothetical protein